MQEYLMGSNRNGDESLPVDKDLFWEGRWNAFPRRFVWMVRYVTKERLNPSMVIATVEMLAFLIRFSQVWISKGKDVDGWVFCKEDLIYRELGLPHETQWKILKILVDAGWIERTKRKGDPKRWLKVDKNQILVDLHSAHSRWLKEFGLEEEDEN
jgi:hypothetical protein